MKLRAGTVNVLGPILFLKGLKYCYKNMNKHVDVASWVKYFRDCSSIYTVISAPDQENVLWNTVNLVVNGKIAHDVMMKLDMHHIAVSTGSACSTGAVDVSAAISALERPDVTNGSIRISFGYPTTVNDLDFIVSKFIDIFN
jgi:cysteine desulfurase